jgi:hypothetical protein
LVRERFFAFPLVTGCWGSRSLGQGAVGVVIQSLVPCLQSSQNDKWLPSGNHLSFLPDGKYSLRCTSFVVAVRQVRIVVAVRGRHGEVVMWLPFGVIWFVLWSPFGEVVMWLPFGMFVMWLPFSMFVLWVRTV